MALLENFVALKTVTVLNVACWVSYYILVGSYTNIIGNMLVLVGVALSVWRHVHTTEPPPITSSGVTVPVDTGSLRQAELRNEQE